MTREFCARFVAPVAGLTLAVWMLGAPSFAQQPNIAIPPTQSNVQALPNMGQQITPLAPQGSRFEPMNPGLADNPEWLAGQAVTTVVSPDHNTLLVLTSGYNRVYSSNSTQWSNADSNEYVFIYDISARTPRNKQVVQIPNSYNGIVFDPSGTAFYVAGGTSDNVHIFTLAAGTWTEAAGSALALGHTAGGLGIGAHACSAGLAISNDGKTLVVVNYYNDSITVFTGGYGNWVKTAGTRSAPRQERPDEDRHTRRRVSVLGECDG